MPTPTGNEDILGAVTSACNYCWDEDHGYRLSGNMNPDIDCSGLVWWSLHDNGFDMGSSRWDIGFDTYGMIAYLDSYPGFAHYTWQEGEEYPTLQHGDILVYREGGSGDDGHGHAYIYAENVFGYTDLSSPYQNPNYPATTGICARARVEALSAQGHYQSDGVTPIPHDQANNVGAHNEVLVHASNSFFYGGHKWHIFRWGGTPPGPTPTSDMVSGIIAGMLLNKKRRGFN